MALDGAKVKGSYPLCPARQRNTAETELCALTWRNRFTERRGRRSTLAKTADLEKLLGSATALVAAVDVVRVRRHFKALREQ